MADSIARRGGLAEAADRGVAHAPARARSSSASSSCALPRGAPGQQAGERLLLAHGADPARHALPAGLVAEEGGDAHAAGARGRRVSSKRRTTPEPSVAPSSRASSKVRRRSSSSGVTNPPAAPPSSTAWSGRRRRRRRRARAARAAWCRTAPRRCPGRSTAPETQNSLGPVDFSVPICGEGRAALEHDRQHVDERLDVVDHRRLAEQALDRPGTAACCAARRGSPRSS